MKSVYIALLTFILTGCTGIWNPVEQKTEKVTQNSDSGNVIVENTNTWSSKDSNQITDMKYGYYIMNQEVYHTWKRIQNADVKSFQILNKNYSKDKNQVYLDNWDTMEIIKWADPFTFSPLWEDSWWGKDKSDIYFNDEKKDWVDPDSFVILSKGFAKDTHRVYATYSAGSPIDWADPKTFIIINDSFWKDKNNIYLDPHNPSVQKLNHIDLESFSPIKDNWYKDKDHLFSFADMGGYYGDEEFVSINNINVNKVTSDSKGNITDGKYTYVCKNDVDNNKQACLRKDLSWKEEPVLTQTGYINE